MRFLLLLAWICSASAAPLGEADAVRIGRAANLEGLRALIAERNQGLVFRAMENWSIGQNLPPALEALAVEYYADPVAQTPLLGRLGRDIDPKALTRQPKYSSRRLFDLMYADLKAGRAPQHYATRIVCTDLPVEAELTALLSALPPEAANELAMFLGARRYAAAVPALQALQARFPYERNTNQMIEHVDWAYLQIGTPEAIQALLARLRMLGTMRDERAGSEVWNILLYVNRLPAGHPPAFAELDAALPAQLNPSATSEVVKLIAARKEKAGIPRLVRSIAESPKAGEAIDALLAVGEPADWRAGRTALEQSALDGKSRTPLFARLDAALSNPGQAYAQREQRAQADAEQRETRRVADDMRRISGYKSADPGRYGAEMKSLLRQEEARMEKATLARSYQSLATFYRFNLRQPDEALSLYEAANQLRPANTLDISTLAMADTLRFDKRNPRKAIEQYRRAAGSLSAASPREARFAAAFKRWIDVEVAYLGEGRRFSGPIGPSDMEMAFLWLGLAQQEEPIVPPPDPATLARLPASQFQIGRALPSPFELEPAQMLAFFDKHDPAGYLTAAVLAFAAAKEPSPYVKAAAQTFFRARGIQTASAAPADARFATPQKTWGVFVAAAKDGDAARVLACFTDDMRARLEPLLKRLSRQELRDMGASFTGFAMQSEDARWAEAMIVRQEKDQRRGGFVTFVREGAGWKIDSM